MTSRTAIRFARVAAIVAAVAGAALGAEGPNWSAWFEKNTTVTDKKAYVHFFWNAQDVRARLQGKEREPLAAEAARQLVLRLYPKKASADLMKIDIVFVSERDGYGMPKWDTLQRVAHVECSKRKLLAVPASAPAAELRKAFDRFELY